MHVSVQLPDDLAGELGDPAEIPGRLLEAFAMEGYRSQRLSHNQVGRLLGLDYWQTEDLLTRHDAKRPYKLADLQEDRKTLAELEAK
ncbi:MAG: UPF0175 family protein [Thermoguttaceae bacterium]|jgi:hypothetical protein